MSSIKYQLYVDGIMRLTNSLVLKDESVAIAVNAEVNRKGLFSGFSVDLQRPDTWKYYLNLAGRYHPFDAPMEIVSLDTMETISFDVETLKTHRATVREYRQDSRYYNELIERYPNQEVLISGILNPVDITTAINARNYTILYHDASEVEPQEFDLIPNLQKWIFAFVRRWYVRDYQITDLLFNCAFLGQLFAQLPAVIMSLRQENIRSYRAHSFHVWSYLESTGRLGRFRGYLTEEQQMWLYRNIRWVFLNSGKKQTFEALVETLLSKRSIPIGHYRHRLDTEEIQTALYGTPEFERTPLNLLDVVSRTKPIRTVEFLLEKESPLARDNMLYLEEHQAIARDSFKNTIMQEGPSRVMESEMLDRSQMLPVTLKEFQIQHWFYLACAGRYNATIVVNNPYTTEQFQLTVKDAALLWFYLGCKLNGVELLEIPRLVTYVVRKMPLPSIAQLKSKVGSSVTDAEVRNILGAHEPIRNTISTEAFYDATERMHKVFLEQRYIYHNEQHYFKRAELESVILSCYQDYICDFTTETTFTGFFNALGLSFSAVPMSDVQIMFDQISKVAIGADLRDVKSVKDIQTAMLQMMRQLGAYTTQIIQSINTQPAIILDTPAIRIGEFNTVQRDSIQVDNEETSALDVIDIAKDKAVVSLTESAFVKPVNTKERLNAKLDLQVTARLKTGVREIIRVGLPASYINPLFTGREFVDSWDDIPDSNYVEPEYNVNFIVRAENVVREANIVFTTTQIELVDLVVSGTTERTANIGFDIQQLQLEDLMIAGSIERTANIQMSFTETAVREVADVNLVGLPGLVSVEMTTKTDVAAIVSNTYPVTADIDSVVTGPFGVTVRISTTAAVVSDVYHQETEVAINTFTLTNTVLRQNGSDNAVATNEDSVYELQLKQVALRTPTNIGDSAVATNEDSVYELSTRRVAIRKATDQDALARTEPFAVTVNIVTL
jgi:hypothetical protein